MVKIQHKCAKFDIHDQNSAYMVRIQHSTLKFNIYYQNSTHIVKSRHYGRNRVQNSTPILSFTISPWRGLHST